MPESEYVFPDSSADHLVKSDKGAAADEKYVRGVNLYEFLMRVFASAFRRDVCNSPLQDFQKSLLDAFPDTSRVMLGESALRPILSISSM